MMVRMRTAALASVALTLALSVPLASQDEDKPYFSISSSISFASGGEPFINLSAYGVEAVKIRVYRVNDPVQFMRQLREPHAFGGSYRPLPNGKMTLLERLHEWKRSLRRDIRYDLRAQFTESPRAHWEKNESAPEANKNKATYYAEAPILNPQQLVLSFVQPVSQKAERWDTQKVTVPVKDKGVFLVEAVHGEMSAYTILSVSDMVLLTKVGRDRILYYVADKKSGEPVAGATVTAMERNSDGTALQTGADGSSEYLVKTTPADDVRVVAMHGKDVAISDVEPWSLNQRSRNLSGVVYTDRPVYRPGDTAHFRAILRYQETTGYLNAGDQTFSVQVTDRDGNPVYKKDLHSNKQGILHDELTLGKDAALGNYFVEVRSGEATTYGNFEVQEYKKPEYEVHVTPADRRVLQGKRTQVTIDSRYYFGEPVVGAKVSYSIYQSRYWFPIWYEPDEDNAEAGAPDDNGDNQEAKQGEGKLDADGKLVISVATEVASDKTDQLYRIEARVTDEAGREISGTGWVIASYGDFVTNVEPDKWFYQPGDAATFRVEARDYDNHPVTTPMHVELRRYDWTSRDLGPVVAQGNVETGSDGTGAVTLTLPAKGGDYRLIATAPSAGRTVESSVFVWVAGNSLWDEEGGGSKPVTIIPDKKTYQPGDTAQIMIATGRDNTPVLVTVEGRNIRSHQLLRAKGGTATFSYKVTKEDEPAFFVSAEFFYDGELHQGAKRVKAPPIDHKLDIRLSTDKPQYLPGQPATYSIDVKTSDGQPAAGTELSLGVVDEAIYAIVKDSTPDLVDVFYGREYNSVQTLDSLTYFFNGEAGTRRMQLAALRPKTRLAQLKPEQLIKPKIRKYFPDTTFWAADLTTDAQGHAQAKFAFPDSLTTWRATARASSADDRYGSAILKTIVRKNVILRLAVPRFFIQGDEVVISAIVHNYLENDKQAKIDLKMEGLDVLSGAPSQQVTIPKRGEAKVDWRVKARMLRSSKITAEALTNEESDGLELELPIHPPGVPVSDPKSGSITDAGTTRLSFTYPKTAVLGSRSISIRLTPSVAGSVFSALEYLTSYPYGCVEQTMSSFLPDVIVTKTMRELKLRQPMDQASLDEKIQAGLKRLYGFHHEDGGWGWWQTDDSHPFMTAYVVAGLAMAGAADIAVDHRQIDDGSKWIERYLKANPRIAADLKAYMVYALATAGHADSNALESVNEQRRDLSSYGLAFLGLAFEQVKDKRAAEIAGQLEAKAEQKGDEVSWPATRDEMLDFSADTTPETTAFVTDLLSRERPQSPLLPKAALWLVNHRDEGYWWSSTKQTAMVIYGLTDYLKASNELHPDTHVSVKVNGEAAGTADFKDDITAAPVITLDEGKLHADSNEVQIETTGSGRTYYSVDAEHYSDEAKAENQGTIALNLLRDYYRLTPTQSDKGIVYDSQPLNGTVTQGDVLAVRLTVTGSEWRYLMVEDPIPAGTEFVKDDRLYHLKTQPPWWQYWFTERENHDDRIALFINWFSQDQKEYFYLLKVVNAGVFHVSPARVTPMYQHGYRATTASMTLEVK